MVNEASSTQIAASYHFGVELLSWVSLVVQSWVEHQKKKSRKDKKEWVKATLEPFINKLHDLSTTLATLQFQEYKAQGEHTSIFATDTLKEIQPFVGVVARDINSSRKQSQATLTSIITTRAKVLVSLKI